MKIQINNFGIEDWINEQVSIGKYNFSGEKVEMSFPFHSKDAIKLSLNRLSRKGKIVSVHKGFYVIISPEYSTWGILPPVFFIDDLMKYLNRPYYVGLLNAAAFYGASHQSPQEFFVFTNFPTMRPMKKKGIKINYISKSEIFTNLLEDKKTETGYLKVSSPDLTAVDVVQYQKRIGGLNRAAAVLEELAETLDIGKFKRSFLNEIQTSVLQRLGYLFEKVIGYRDLSEKIYTESQDMKLDFFPVPLDSAKNKRGFSGDNRWKVIVNTEIEIE